MHSLTFSILEYDHDNILKKLTDAPSHTMRILWITKGNSLTNILEGT